MNNIPVFLSSDNNYAPFVATTMLSILSHTSSFIDFYILEDRITASNKEKILAVSKHFKNFNVEFVSIITDEVFKDFPIHGHIRRAAYSRYLIPQIKPDFKKIIYSDVDVIFMDDIRKLYDTELNGYIIAAVPYYRKNKDFYKETATRLGLSNNNVFASGLLIIDCQKWNENDITSRLMTVTSRLTEENKLRTEDQDAINCLFDDNYVRLQIKWCIYPSMLKKEYTQDEINELTRDKGIIHYADRRKPWNHKLDAFAEYFWHYVPYTEFLYQIERMNTDVISSKKLHYKRKIIKIIIKMFVSKPLYKKFKRDPISFFDDSKNSFIQLLGRHYFNLI